MFPCIGCAKQTDDDWEERDGGSARQRGTPQRQDSVKKITTQLKDMVLKFSGSSKQSRSGQGSSSRARGPMQFPEFRMSEGTQHPYLGGVGSGSAPAWNLRGSLSGRSDETMIFPPADQTPSRDHEPVAAPDAVVEEEDDGRAWVFQVEPGVTLFLETLPDGGNNLQRIMFSPNLFTRLEGPQWWYDNHERVIEHYDIKKIKRVDVLRRNEDQQPGDISFPVQSSVTESPVAEWLNNHVAPRHGIPPSDPAITFYQGPEIMQHYHAGSSSTTAPRGEGSSSMANGLSPAEWIQPDRDGVYITMCVTPIGTKEIRRLRFSHEHFGDEEAQRWWEENKDRLRAEYL